MTVALGLAGRLVLLMLDWSEGLGKPRSVPDAHDAGPVWARLTFLMLSLFRRRPALVDSAENGRPMFCSE